MKDKLDQFARHSRRNMTVAEEKLWHHLRSDIVLQKTHFRRQVILKSYIVDFCCHASRLIIEVDGATHSTKCEIQKDEIRTRHLNEIGYHVLRFTNDDILTSIASVMDTIYAALQETPHVISETEKFQIRNKKTKYRNSATVLNTPTPYPSPQGGGENILEATHNNSSFPFSLEGEGEGGG